MGPGLLKNTPALSLSLSLSLDIHIYDWVIALRSSGGPLQAIKGDDRLG